MTEVVEGWKGQGSFFWCVFEQDTFLEANWTTHLLRLTKTQRMPDVSVRT